MNIADITQSIYGFATRNRRRSIILADIFFPYLHTVDGWQVCHRPRFNQRLREWIGNKLQWSYKAHISLHCPYEESSRDIVFFWLRTSCKQHELQWIEDIYAFFYIYPEY